MHWICFNASLKLLTQHSSKTCIFPFKNISQSVHCFKSIVFLRKLLVYTEFIHKKFTVVKKKLLFCQICLYILGKYIQAFIRKTKKEVWNRYHIVFWLQNCLNFSKRIGNWQGKEHYYKIVYPLHTAQIYFHMFHCIKVKAI